MEDARRLETETHSRKDARARRTEAHERLRGVRGSGFGVLGNPTPETLNVSSAQAEVNARFIIVFRV